MHEKKSMNVIAKGAAILLGGAIIGKILAFIYRIILSRLGENTYGEISLALSIFSILSVIAILGLDTGVLRYLSIFKKEDNKEKTKGTIFYASKIILLLSITFAVVLFLCADWINTEFFQTENLTIILQIFAIALPFEALKAVSTSALKAFQKVEYDIYARIIGEALIRIILTIILIKLGFGIIGATIAYTLSIILSSTTLFIFFEKKVFSFLNKEIQSAKKNAAVLRYSLPLVLNSITIITINAADSILLGFFKDAAVVGVYNIAIPTAKLILIFPTALLGLYLPLLATVQENKKEFTKVYYTTTKWVFFVTTLSLAWLILYGKELIILFFTESYSEAYIPLVILAIGYLINSCIYTSRDILLLFNHTKTIFIATSISCIANILLNILLIPDYGMIGAALATAISLTLLSLMLFWKSYKITKRNPFTKRIWIIAAIITFASLLSKYISTNITMQASYIDIILSILLLTTITTIFMLFSGVLEKEDTDMAKTILRKIKTTLTWKTSKES